MSSIASYNEENKKKISIKYLTLANNKELIRQVKQLNLGILPIQPPAICYTRTLKELKYQFSYAAIDTRTNAIIGGMIADLENKDKEIQQIIIRTLCVDPRYRRQNIGTKLLQLAIEQGVQLNDKQAYKNQDKESTISIECILLHVHSINEDAIAFYKKIGFQQVDMIENYYRRLKPSSCIVMKYIFENIETLETKVPKEHKVGQKRKRSL